MIWGKSSTSFFCKWISSFLALFVEKTPFSFIWSDILNLVGHECKDLFLESQFYFIDLYVWHLLVPHHFDSYSFVILYCVFNMGFENWLLKSIEVMRNVNWESNSYFENRKTKTRFRDWVICSKFGACNWILLKYVESYW